MEGAWIGRRSLSLFSHSSRHRCVYEIGHTSAIDTESAEMGAYQWHLGFDILSLGGETEPKSLVCIDSIEETAGAHTQDAL